MSGEILSNRLAGYFCGVTFDDLSADHVEKMKVFFLDWLGSAYAGKDLPPIRMMRKVVRGLGGVPEATSIPDGVKTSCLLASLVNGASSHIVEMDDLHRESILHPAAAILPAVLAAGEREGVSGKELIVAVSVGYEVGIRVALAVGPSHYRFWHTTATCGTFGAAAGAAKLLRLNEDQFAWAIGSAGTQASGLWEFLGESAMSKQLHTGKAAMNGLLCGAARKGGFYRGEENPRGGERFFPRYLTGFRRKQMHRRSGQGIPLGAQLDQVSRLLRPYAFRRRRRASGHRRQDAEAFRCGNGGPSDLSGRD